MKRLPSGSPMDRPRGNTTNFAGQTSGPDWLGE